MITAEPPSLRKLIDRYLDQIKTLKKPNTHRKYDAVLTRFAKVFDRRTLDSVSTEELNDYVVELMKSGMSANTVLHNVVIIAQFCKRNGRAGLTRLLHLPERISPLPLEYNEEELGSFFGVTTDRERELFCTFLLTGFREQEVAFLFWSDVNLKLRTIRVTSKPHLGFSPKRWEERFRSPSSWLSCSEGAHTFTVNALCSPHRLAIGSTTCCSNAKQSRSARGWIQRSSI